MRHDENAWQKITALSLTCYGIIGWNLMRMHSRNTAMLLTSCYQEWCDKAAWEKNSGHGSHDHSVGHLMSCLAENTAVSLTPYWLFDKVK